MTFSTKAETHARHSRAVTTGEEVALGDNGFGRDLDGHSVAGSPGEVRLDSPPAELDDLVDWFERLCSGLVLLEPYPVAGLRTVVDRVSAEVRAHCRESRWATGVGPSSDPERARLRAILEADHHRFETSLEQLGWFFGVVEREDHGGHRQALGQYGRVLAESLRRHLADERRFVESNARPDRDRSEFSGKP